MVDFASNIARNFKKSLPDLERAGFKYLSTEGLSFLQKISDNLMMAIEQNKQSLSTSSVNPKENNDKKWVSILNSSENWARFKKDKTQKEIKDIDRLHQFWMSQNQFSLASNKSLVESLNVILFCLNHVQKALKEYEKNTKNKRNLDKRFGKIHSLNERLKIVKSQLNHAMLVRLKTAYIYGNLKNHKIPDVDDVVYYVAHSLNGYSALSSDEQKILPFEPRQGFSIESQSLFPSAVSENYYVKFYDYLRACSKTKGEQKEIDAFHWSKIIHNPVFRLSNSRSKYGSIISIPTFLSKFAPIKYQTPAWWYWQENATLKFWSRRQDFLVDLNGLWVAANNANNKKSVTKDENEVKKAEEAEKAKKEKCMALINDELSKVGAENPSFFAFDYKEMLEEWKVVLINMRSELLQSMRDSDVKASKFFPQKNVGHENKNGEGVKKTQSKENSKPNILEALKQSENECQDFMSDDLPIKLSNPKLSVNTDWKDLKEPPSICVSQTSQFCMNGSSKARMSPKKQELKEPSTFFNSEPSKVEAALRSHR